MTALVQISKVEGKIDRVPRDETPVVELHVEPNERVISIDLRCREFDHLERKTVDWRWTAYVETRL